MPKANGAKKTTLYGEGDTVTWAANSGSHRLYGRGPFIVAFVSDSYGERVVGHPQWLFIRKEDGEVIKNNRGEPKRFSGIWFARME